MCRRSQEHRSVKSQNRVEPVAQAGVIAVIRPPRRAFGQRDESPHKIRKATHVDEFGLDMSAHRSAGSGQPD